MSAERPETNDNPHSEKYQPNVIITIIIITPKMKTTRAKHIMHTAAHNLAAEHKKHELSKITATNGKGDQNL